MDLTVTLQSMNGIFGSSVVRFYCICHFKRARSDISTYKCFKTPSPSRDEMRSLKRVLTVSCNRTLACLMDREGPFESENHAEHALRGILWCRVSGLGGLRFFMLACFLTHRRSNCISFP